MSEQRGELRVPAIEVRQSPGRLLYSFAVDGKQIPSLCDGFANPQKRHGTPGLSATRGPVAHRGDSHVSRERFADGPECRCCGLRFTSGV